MADFIDYYRILQVHFDATPDVIRTAYKRLCRSYHPDNRANTDDRMILLNQAFDILSDIDKRKIYHQQWLAHFTNRHDYVTNVTSGDFHQNADSALNVIDDFFFALKTNDWETAYFYLTEEDKNRINYHDFIEWREAVSSCSTILDYKINHINTMNHCTIDTIRYKQVTEFKVSITEQDLVTYDTEKSTVHKYAAYDGVSWKICLGTNNIRTSTLTYRMLSERKKTYNPMAAYRNAINRVDPMTGLLSEEGFYEEAEKEVTRSKRYKNPFSILIFCLHSYLPEKNAACTCQFAEVLKRELRSTDIIGHLINEYFICLLTETRKFSAEAAAKKILKNIVESPTALYQIKYVSITYMQGQTLKQIINNACLSLDK